MTFQSTHARPSFSNLPETYLWVTHDDTKSLIIVKTDPEKVDKLVKEQLQTGPEKGNADFKLTPGRTLVYCGIDATGGLRQGSSTVQTISILAHASPHLTGAASAVVPLGLLVTGPLSMATASTWTIPDAYKGLKSANEELDRVKNLDIADISKPVLLQNAENASEIAKLGLANHGLYFSMGAAQTASGIVGMCSPSMAHVLHYAPVLTGHAATVASTTTGVALGVIYVARGGVMLVRAVKNYREVQEFHKDFANQLNDQKMPIQAAMRFMEAVEALGPTYLDRRVDPSCLEKKDKDGNLIGTFTAKGLKPSKGELKNYNSDAEKIEYLQCVDKGLYTEELKHKIAIVIAIAMIIGGILAIAVSVATGGAAAIVIVALVSAIFFMSMEYIFMTYDSSKLFEWLRDRLYKMPEHLVVKQPVLNDVINPLCK